MKENKLINLWGIPLVLAVLTLFGLIAALTGTGVWHWLSWLALSIPIVIILRYLFKKTPTGK